MNISIQQSVLACVVVVVTALAMPASHAASVHKSDQDEAQRNSRHRRSGRDANLAQYGWLCPSVVCPTLPVGCRRVEYIVYQYMHPVGPGKKVQVRCEGCRFCNDPPFRVRRSHTHHAASQRRHQICEDMSCPAVPTGCNSVHLTDMYLEQQYCKPCPACYDNTLLEQEHIEPL